MASIIQPQNLSLVTLASTFKTTGAPLTDKELFYSFAEAELFAKSDSAYVGQVITVIASNVVTHYSIQLDNTLKPISLGDEFLEALKASVNDPVAGAVVTSILAERANAKFVLGFTKKGDATTGYHYEPYVTTLDDGEI